MPNGRWWISSARWLRFAVVRLTAYHLRQGAEVSTHTANERPALTRRQIKVLFGGLMTGMLLSALDQTIVGTALPTIAGKLGDLGHYSWVVIAYLLASTATTPLYGKLSDQYGRRPLLRFAIVTFVVGSLLVGVSQDMTQLIVFRAVQGLGAGGLIALPFTIVSDVLAPRDRARYQGLFGAVFGVASIAGPLLGGYFADYDWRWIFFLNLPLGILALFVTDRVLRLVPHQRRDHPVDYLGALVIAAGVVALLLAASWGGVEYPWSSPVIVGLIAAGVMLSVVFVVVESRVKEPILSLSLFRRRTLALGYAGSFVFGIGLFGAVVFVPMYLQLVRGTSPTGSGLLMVPMMASVIATSILGGRAVGRFGRYKWAIVSGAVMVTSGMLLFSRLELDTPLWLTSCYMVVTGIGIGLSMQPLLLAVQNSLQLREMGSGTSAISFFRTLGGSFGVAVLGAVLSARLDHWMARLMPAALAELPEGVAQRLPSGANRELLTEPSAILALPGPVRDAIQESFVNGLGSLFLVAAGFAAAAVVVTALMPNDTLEGTAPGPGPAAVPARDGGPSSPTGSLVAQRD